MIVNGTAGFFPLAKIRPRLEGYFMRADGTIYSTKQFKTPKLMAGTCAPRASRTYTFTMSGTRSVPTTVRGDELFASAKRHVDWASDTSTTTQSGGVTVPMPSLASILGVASKPDAARHHASNTAAGIAKKGYIIGQVQGEAIVFGSKPVVHTTLTSVKSEVERLAMKSPGTQIIYVKIEGGAIANGIAWQ